VSEEGCREHEGLNDPGAYRRWCTRDEDVEPPEPQCSRVMKVHRHGEETQDEIDYGRQFRDVLAADSEHMRTTLRSGGIIYIGTTKKVIEAEKERNHFHARHELPGATTDPHRP
jgi:hypothetical protein